MDDYNVNVLSEAKSEYSNRLVAILTPLIVEGIKSIFNEADKLCINNDEEDKYLMTFQNFLSRVPKWNSTIIEEETKRIVKLSQCNYLEDLLTCVHITQLKILTSIRVSQKQKKIDIDIPKLNTFIHKCYIIYARKLYSNVYLFEKSILPLSYQKNMREAELMCQESILQVVRDGMPVETILRAYIDETVDEEVIEETVEKTVEVPEKPSENIEETSPNVTEIEKTEITKTEEVSENKELNDVKKPKLESSNDNTENNVKSNAEEQNINLVIQTPVATSEVSKNKDELTDKKSDEVDKTSDEVDKTSNKVDKKSDEADASQESTTTLKFNDTDTVLDLNTNRKTNVSAPKTLERLEQISKERHAQRKAEAEEEEEEEEDKLVIHSNTELNLDKIDIHDLDKKLNMKPDPVLDDIEILT